MASFSEKQLKTKSERSLLKSKLHQFGKDAHQKVKSGKRQFGLLPIFYK